LHLFLTGATGSVGLEVLRILRNDKRFKRVTCLLRGTESESAEHRWQHFLEEHHLQGRIDGCGPMFDYVEGDILKPDLALTVPQIEGLQRSVTHILHLAAYIRFDASYDEAHTINVEGTRRIVELAHRCRSLRGFGHVSTLYVVGTRHGKLPENAEPEGYFNNAYEQTKYEAEQLVRASGLPADIYRLALLQGRSEDGYVHHFLESHMLMDAFCRGSCALLPGSPTARLDMLPTDYTAQALVCLLTEQPFSGRIWSIAAGDGAPSIAELYQLICQRMVMSGKLPPSAPRFIEQSALQKILQSDDPYEYGISPGACAILETVGGYLFYPKIYTPSVIPGMPPPPMPAEWMKPVLDYCLASGWGRRRVNVN